MEHRKSSASARRSAARLAAVQALYQCDMTAIGTEQVLGEFVRFRLDADAGAGEPGDGPMVAPDRALFAAVVRGVARRRADIDRMIEGALGPQWSFQRLEVLLRMILRAGVWELLENPTAETRVVIAEYLDLTDAFFTGREPAMVNAVLDRIGRAVRDEGSAFDPAETAADQAPGGRAAEPEGGG